MSKKEISPRICLGCGEWFDPVGNEKNCGAEGCKDRAGEVGAQYSEHLKMVKKNYSDPARWMDGDRLQLNSHANWRADHPPRRAPRRMLVLEEPPEAAEGDPPPDRRPAWEWVDDAQLAAPGFPPPREVLAPPVAVPVAAPVIPVRRPR